MGRRKAQWYPGKGVMTNEAEMWEQAASAPRGLTKEKIKKLSRNEAVRLHEELCRSYGTGMPPVNNANRDCEEVWFCSDCTECEKLHDCARCHDCSDSDSLLECDSCWKCSYCVGLSGRTYCILNVQFSKEEYEEIVSELTFS